MGVADDLDKAADVITERGWCQGEPQDASGQLCAIGAINIAVLGRASVVADGVAYDGYAKLDSSQRGALVAHEMLRATIETEIVSWNDDEGRTKGEVVAALRAAAKKARGET